MPAAGYHKRTYTGPRPWEITDASPFSEIADIRRGQLRLAAEVALAELRGDALPGQAVMRAVEILEIMAAA